MTGSDQTPLQPLPLGDLLLETPIGRGGTAMVWRAKAVGSGAPVAVKVFEPERWDLSRARSAFHTEVGAQLRLDHPRIVRVRSHGVIAVEEQTPELKAGAAWLAMDLAPLGSLDRYERPLSWYGIRGVLIAVLDALAHAHARGVVHRDLKAANLLVFEHATEPGGPPEVRIADFGLASAVRAPSTSGQLAGTPRAMAPEQFRGVAADQGPWTDLYAVGCLAWELVCGEPVFPGADAESQRVAHLLHEPRPLPAGVSVPLGFEAWLHRCLSKSPEGRFRFAADAAHALLALPELDGEQFERVVALEGLTTLPVDDGPAHTLSWALDPIIEHAGTEPRSSDAQVTFLPPPPCPRSWRRGFNRDVGADGSIAGLFGLQRRPMVGRNDERDLAWASLIEARKQRQPRVVVVRGAVGVGRSRFASWLAERWHEVGGGPIVAVRCQEGMPGGTLERVVARLLGLEGAPPEEARARLDVMLQRQSVVDRYEIEALAQLLRLTSSTRAESVLSSEAERWAVVLRAMARAEPGRVPVVVLDDAQLDPDTIGFARWVLTRASPGAVIVLTVPEGEVDQDGDSMLSVAHARRPVPDDLGSLESNSRTTALQLEALDHANHTALLRVLGLSGELAAEVAERTSGNPLFAVQLVEEMLRRGAALDTPEGVIRAPGAEMGLPSDAGAVWAERLERVRTLATIDEAKAVALGALLGVEIPRELWSAACSHKGWRLPIEAAEALCREGFWQARPWGWVATHALAREAMLEAIPHSLAPELHAACVWAISALLGTGPEVAGRLGRHRLEAGDPAGAFSDLIRAARHERERGSLDSALVLVQWAGRALRALKAADEDKRQATLSLVEAELLALRGRPDAALRRLPIAARLARQSGMDQTLTQVLLLEGQLARQRGELMRASELLRRARDLAGASSDPAGEAKAVLALARVAHRQGRVDDAERLAREGLKLARSAKLPRSTVSALRTLAGVARIRLDIPSAFALAEASRAEAVSVHDRLGEAGALVALGRAAEVGEDPEAARAFFQRASDLYETIGSPEGHVARLHMARTLSVEGRFAEARTMVEAAGAAFARLGWRGGLAAVDVVRLSLDAQARDWAGWRIHLRRARRLLGSTGLRDPDLVLGLERAARVALSAEQPEHARDAFRAASELWTQFGDAVRAQHCLQWAENAGDASAPATR